MPDLIFIAMAILHLNLIFYKDKIIVDEVEMVKEQFTHVILLPDDDGKVGKVSISNETGTTIISNAYTQVKASAKTKPLSTSQVDKMDVELNYQQVFQSKPRSVSHYQLFFKNHLNNLSLDSQKIVPELINDLKSRTHSEINIIGHTDTVGNSGSNSKLGLTRAEYLKTIILLHLPKSNIKVTSQGEQSLLVQTKDNISELKNRRVEIEIR